MGPLNQGPVDVSMATRPVTYLKSTYVETVK